MTTTRVAAASGDPTPDEREGRPETEGDGLRRAALVVGACTALAVASLPLPAALGYDPWAWLVWGREVGHLSLDTTGGPSWKPLPVLVTTLVAPAGTAAPTLWLVVARTAGLLALVGAARVAWRLAGPWAGALAAGLLVLTPDVEARFLRLVGEGHSAPLTAALALWAWDRHLAGGHRSALVLGAALALDRPEAWPLLAAYGVWMWRGEPRARPLLVTVAVALPVLWFGADWWGAGRPWHGADVAQVDAQDTDRLPTALSRAAESVTLVAWAGAAVCVALAVRARDRVPLVAAAGAAVWFSVVVAMSAVLGYAAIGRFHLPAAAVVCVLAAVGAVRGVRAAPAGRGRQVAAGLAAVVLAGGLVGRAAGLPELASDVRARAVVEADLDRALEAAGGAEALAGTCGRVVIDDPTIPRVAVAWKLDLPLHEVGTLRAPVAGPATAVVRTDGRVGRAYAADPSDAVERARNDRWAVYAVGCGGRR